MGDRRSKGSPIKIGSSFDEFSRNQKYKFEKVPGPVGGYVRATSTKADQDLYEGLSSPGILRRILLLFMPGFGMGAAINRCLCLILTLWMSGSRQTAGIRNGSPVAVLWWGSRDAK